MNIVSKQNNLRSKHNSMCFGTQAVAVVYYTEFGNMGNVWSLISNKNMLPRAQFLYTFKKNTQLKYHWNSLGEITIQL